MATHLSKAHFGAPFLFGFFLLRLNKEHFYKEHVCLTVIRSGIFIVHLNLEQQKGSDKSHNEKDPNHSAQG